MAAQLTSALVAPGSLVSPVFFQSTGTCPECLRDCQTGSGLAAISPSSSVLMDASSQDSWASLICVNVPELLPLPLRTSFHCSGLPCNLRSLAFLNASLCGRDWGNEVLCTVPFVTSPPAAFSSLSLVAAGAILFWIDVTFVLKSCCVWWVFFLLIFSFASFSVSLSESQVLGVVTDSCTSWCIRNWVALCIPEYLSAAEQRTWVVSWCFWLLFCTLTQFPFCSYLTQASLLSSKSGNWLDAVFINKVC